MYRKRKMLSGASKAKRRATLNAFRRRPYVALSQPFRFPMYYADQPPRKFARLKYTTIQTTASFTAGNIVVYEYRANGMYDPEVALGGHQPYGFDQLMAQYNNFTVLSSTITAEGLQNSNNRDQQWRLFCYTIAGTPATAFGAGGLNTLLELPIQSQGVLLAAGEHLEKMRRIGLSCNVAKFAGKPAKDLIGELDYRGTDTADPTKQVYFALVGWEPALGAGAANLFKITITYNCVFTDPRYFIPS